MSHTIDPYLPDCEGLGSDAPERDVRWHASRAVLLGHPEAPDGGRPVYLPAVAVYFIAPPELRVSKSWGTTTAAKSAQVRLPEGTRGALSKLATTIYAARSAAAAAPCDRAEDGRHAWHRTVGGRIWCDACGCDGELEELSLVEAPLLLDLAVGDGTAHSSPRYSGQGWPGGGVGCYLGDESTRRLWAEICSARTDAIRRFGLPDDVLERRALYQRAAEHPLDSGGRWLLPERYTPEGARAEGERWTDLGELLISVACEAGDADAISVWRAWLAGDPAEGPHQHQPPREIFDEALYRALEEIARQLGDGRPVYVDARAVVGAISRTRQRWSAHLPLDPADPPRELREMHERLDRRTRGSLLLLLPAKPAEGRDELAHVRALWASGR